MKAELISIGTEITSGQNLDTNTQWLSRRLAEMGIPVGFHTSVADNVDDNHAVFRTATMRANLVISTGGLGPTLDDLTREVLAHVAGVELIQHDESLRHIEQLFASRKRAMPDRNKVQAQFPVGAEPLFNPIGTAPGIWMKIGNAWIAAMPGVPSEMYRMFEEQLKPRLAQMGLTRGILVQRKINTFGAGESAVEEMLKDVTARGRTPEVGITASDAVISLRILARAEKLEDAHELWAPTEQIIRDRLGVLVYGVEDEQLQDAVMRLLMEQNLTIATAESMTAGLITHRLAQIPGASRHLRGGVVCYDSEVKRDLLGVPQAMLDQHGPVSAEVAELLAKSVREKMNADIGVSIVGYAGPEGGGPGKPVGLTFVAVADSTKCKSSTFQWFGTRQEILSRGASMALNAVRLRLI